MKMERLEGLDSISEIECPISDGSEALKKLISEIPPNVRIITDLDDF